MAELADLGARGGERRGDLVERDGVRVVVAHEERPAAEAQDLLGAAFEQVGLHSEAAAAEQEGRILSGGEFVVCHGACAAGLGGGPGAIFAGTSTILPKAAPCVLYGRAGFVYNLAQIFQLAPVRPVRTDPT